MKLIKLTTTGFKKLNKFECGFTSGLNVIVGDNAAGKSTLLQAIEASLYGPSVLPGSKEHITTWGQARWVLELTFQIGEDEYTVTRTKSTAKLMKGDNLEANGSSPVTKHIEELLGLSAKDFNLFMQSKQGETTGILTFGATALARKVEEFAGISLLDNVQSLANDEWREGRARADAVRPSDVALQETRERLEHLATRKADAESTLKQVTADLEALEHPDSVIMPEGDPKAMRAEAQAYARLQRAVDFAQRAELHAHTAFEQARNVLAETPKPADTEELGRRVVILAAEIKGLKGKADELSRVEGESTSLQRRIDDTQERLAGIDATELQFQDLDDAVSDLDYGIENRRTERAEHAAQLKQLEKATNDAECPTCGTLLTDHDPAKLAAEMADLREKMAACDSVLKSLTASRKEIAATLSEVRAALEEKQRLTDTLAQLEGNLNQVHEIRKSLEGTTLEEYSELLDCRRTDLAEARRELEKVEEVDDLYQRRSHAVRSAEREHDALLVDLEDAKRALKKAVVPASDEQIEALEDAIADAQRKRHELSNALSAAKRNEFEARHNLDMASTQWDSCRQELEKLTNDLEDAKQYETQADKGGRLSRFLRDRRSDYMAEVWNAVIGVASKQVNMATRGAIQSLRYQDNEFVFEEEGMLAPVGCASGAQKAHIGVALRVGLSRALYGSDALLIFDEPTESMREHNAIGLSASLAGAGSQVLLITHREQDQDLAQNIIEVA